jgi:hypothetical protein
MRPHPRDRDVGISAGCQLDLDVPVELGKALVAAQLGSGWAEQPGYRIPRV